MIEKSEIWCSDTKSTHNCATMQKWAGMSDFTSHADARYLCKEVLSYLGQLTLVFICALRGSDVLDCSRRKKMQG